MGKGIKCTESIHAKTAVWETMQFYESEKRN